MSSAQQMDVEMIHGLATIAAGVDHQPVTILGDAELFGDFSSGEQKMSEHGLVFRFGVGDRGNLFFGNDEDVLRSLWADVDERGAEIVLVDDLAFDFSVEDLCEQRRHLITYICL